MRRQAKCSSCGIRYRWTNRVPVQFAACPECGKKLEQIRKMKLVTRDALPLDLREIDALRLASWKGEIAPDDVLMLAKKAEK